MSSNRRVCTETVFWTLNRLVPIEVGHPGNVSLLFLWVLWILTNYFCHIAYYTVGKCEISDAALTLALHGNFLTPDAQLLKVKWMQKLSMTVLYLNI